MYLIKNIYTLFHKYFNHLCYCKNYILSFMFDSFHKIVYLLWCIPNVKKIHWQLWPENTFTNKSCFSEQCINFINPLTSHYLLSFYTGKSSYSNNCALHNSIFFSTQFSLKCMVLLDFILKCAETAEVRIYWIFSDLIIQ